MPILEVIGLLFILLDIYFFGINIPFLVIISVSVYCFYILITLSSIFLDQMIHKQYASLKEIGQLILMVFLEPFVYHPLNIYASIKDYLHFLMQKEKKGKKSKGRGSKRGFIKQGLIRKGSKGAKGA